MRQGTAKRIVPMVAFSVFSCLLSFSGVVAQEWDETTAPFSVLSADEPESDATFGYSVAVGDDIVIIGAPEDEDIYDIDLGTGLVFVFGRDGDEWNEEQVLEGSDSEDGSGFGASVAISEDDNLIAVGAPGGSFDTTDVMGAVYLFEWDEDAEEYTEIAKLEADVDNAGSKFGAAVALEGQRLIVGAPEFGEVILGIRCCGVAYVFEFDEDEEEWIEEQILEGEGTTTTRTFGSYVDLSGDRAVVSARSDIFVFTLDTGSGEFEESAQISTATSNVCDSAIDADVLVYGNTNHWTDFDQIGGAVVLRYAAAEDEWQEEQTLVASDGEDDDLFGVSVDISGDLIVVGSTVGGPFGGTGGAYVYRYDSESDDWVELQKLVPDDGEAQLGNYPRVAIARGTVAHGAPRTDIDGEEDAGELYLYNALHQRFLRGDVDGNGVVSAILDALFLLEWSFSGGDELSCLDAADIDDSGNVSALLDALGLLQWAFADGEAPPAPGTMDCGDDGSDDDLDCGDSYEGCD